MVIGTKGLTTDITGPMGKQIRIQVLLPWLILFFKVQSTQEFSATCKLSICMCSLNDKAQIGHDQFECRILCLAGNASVT